MLKLKGTTGVIIEGKVIPCKKGEHDNVIVDEVSKKGVSDPDKYINENVLLFDGEDLYTMNFTLIGESSKENLKLIKNSDLSFWIDYLNEED